MTEKELLTTAIKSAEFAYSPYSGCKVGAALITDTGEVFTGTNIENASFSATVCAERVAFFKAISEGKTNFRAIAVVGIKNGDLKEHFPPCGVCRQVMREFCSDEFKIILGTPDKFTVFTLAELLPQSFSQEEVIR